MNNVPQGWYPDPNGGSNLRYFDGQAWAPADSTVQVGGEKNRSPWLWVLGGVAVLLAVLVVGGIALWHMVGTTIPTGSTGSNEIDKSSLHSTIIPTLTFPAGSKQRHMSNPDRFEVWDVPLSYADTVNVVRGGLPTGAALDGLVWCTESRSENLTIWSWGTAADYLSVHASGSSLGGSVVSIDREPDAAGCLR